MKRFASGHAGYGFVLALGIMAALSSCTSTYSLIVDERSPEHRNATVIFANDDDDGWYRLISWNDTAIEERLYGENTGRYDKGDEIILTVPAGVNSFTFDMSFSDEAYFGYVVTEYRGKDLELRYNLEAGKLYQVKAEVRSLGIFEADELYLEFFEITSSEEILLKEWKIGEQKFHY